MKTFKMIGVLLVGLLSMGATQCENIDNYPDVTFDNPYLVSGNLITCTKFPFLACKQNECLEGFGYSCREFCCIEGTHEAVYDCYDPENPALDAACTAKVEASSCNQKCLDSCRECTDTCAMYFEHCTGGSAYVDDIGCCWRD